MTENKICAVKAREILDSRGFPTIEVDVVLDDGSFGRASIPSGASTGSREALELRDGDARFFGKGVLKAISNVNNVLSKIVAGMNAYDQKKVDNAMIKKDGTENKSRYGANAILGISIATLKASSKSLGIPLYKYIGDEFSLPTPMINIINGGAHANNNIDFQEFMIVPSGDSFKEKIRKSSEVFHSLKNILQNAGHTTSVGDEGGFAPNLKSNVEAIEIIIKAIEKAGYIPGKDINIALDIAASTFYEDGLYNIKSENKKLTSEELIQFYCELINKYPIVSIEDPFHEEDFESFSILTSKIGNKVHIVGDDLFVTNKKYLKKGIDMGASNAILIKLNQIGSVTEALDTISLARDNGYSIIVSHRSGETEDTFITDFGVGVNAKYIKLGSISRGERICKYNRLLRIEEEIFIDT